MGAEAQTQELLTPDAVKALLTESVSEAVTAALKAANTVADEARPDATKSAAPTVITRRQAFPSISRAVIRASKGRLDGYEAEFTSAAKHVLGWGDDEIESAGSVIWPGSMEEALQVFEYMGAKQASDRVDIAIKSVEATKASTNDGSYSLTGGTAGGILVPPEFAQSLFAYALTSRNAVRRAGAFVYPATSNNVRFPRELTPAPASQIAEGGDMEAGAGNGDAVFAQQSIDVEKQYAYRKWSDELGADSDPAFNVFLNNTVIRDLRKQQDIQYLRGSGSTPQIQGIVGYSGLTTGPDLGANGRTPTHDDFHDAVYLLNAVDADANFAIGHPRVINTLRKKKDADGRYLMTTDGTPKGIGGNQADAMLLDMIPFFQTTNMLITETVGTSTDTTSVIVGDISQIGIIERGGLEVMISPHVYFKTGHLALRATQRTALVILQPSAVLTITGIRP